MRKSLVAPLALLASISLLTSCTVPGMAPKTSPVVPTTPVETVTPVTPATPIETIPAIPVSTGTTESTGTVSESSSGLPPVAALTRKETVTYNTPEGMVPVEFDVTVTNGTITSATSNTLATGDASKYNQDNFAKDLSLKVVGKKATDLSVDAIGGASLTTAAFEQFVHSF